MEEKVVEVKEEDNQVSNVNEGEKSDIPPLPENPPPSQVVAFVESVIENPSSEETIIAPVAAVVESSMQEMSKIEETVVAAATETLKEELVAPVADAIEQILEEASDKVSEITKTDEPPTEQIEETIALLDKVNQGVLPSDESSENSPSSPPPPPPPAEDVATPATPATEETPSSPEKPLPLPQESFDESLSSPLTSANESQSDNTFPPPPPPETLTEQSNTTTTTATEQVVVDEPKVDPPTEPSVADEKVILMQKTTLIILIHHPTIH